MKEKNRPIGLFFLFLQTYEEKMAKKAERTKNRIIQIASLIFHEKGYANTSMSDILSATGLSKGGIYGNFNSKEEIALEAFKYNTRLLFERGKQLINNNKLTSIEKLYSLLKLHYKSLNDPRLTGRCPVLNTAVEARRNAGRDPLTAQHYGHR